MSRSLSTAGIKFMGAVMVTLLVAGCSNDVSAAKDAVRSVVRDPSSIQWANIRTHHWRADDGTSKIAVCGEFNAKNGYGGYAGNKPFAYNVQSHEVIVISDPGSPPPDMGKPTNSSELFQQLTDIIKWKKEAEAQLTNANRMKQMCESS